MEIPEWPTTRRAGACAEAGTTGPAARASSRSTRTAASTTPSISSYITLADVKQMVLDSIDFEVRDAKTGDDLTRSILLQIILEEESGGVPMFSSADAVADHPLLRPRDAGLMGTYLEQNLQAFIEIQKQAAGAGEGPVRRARHADARAVDAVHEDAGAGDAGADGQLSRAVRQAVHGDAGADAGADARHVRHAFPIPPANRRGEKKASRAGRQSRGDAIADDRAAAEPTRHAAPRRRSASSRSAARRRWSIPSRS